MRIWNITDWKGRGNIIVVAGRPVQPGRFIQLDDGAVKKTGKIMQDVAAGLLAVGQDAPAGYLAVKQPVHAVMPDRSTRAHGQPTGLPDVTLSVTEDGLKVNQPRRRKGRKE